MLTDDKLIELAKMDAEFWVNDAKKELQAHVAKGGVLDMEGVFRIHLTAHTRNGEVFFCLVENGPLREVAIRLLIDRGAVVYTIVFDGFHTQLPGYPRSDAIMMISRSQWGWKNDYAIRYKQVGHVVEFSNPIPPPSSNKPAIYTDTTADGKRYNARIGQDSWDLWPKDTVH